MTTIDEQIKILQAYKEGKTVQVKNPHMEAASWMDIPSMGSPLWKHVVEGKTDQCQFDFSNMAYRIKPGQEQVQRIRHTFWRTDMRHSLWVLQQRLLHLLHMLP